MHVLRYRVVDVFTETPLQGNALAVFPDARGLDSAVMQKVARELNLSETAFVLPATTHGCAAHVRIFTPTFEMRFAGHPTIGTSFVLDDEGITPRNAQRFVLQEKVGPIPIRVERGERNLFWLTTPPIAFGATYEPRSCAKALGIESSELLEIPPQLVNAGNPCIFVAVKSATIVDRAFLDMAGMRLLPPSDHGAACVFVFAPVPGGAYARMFGPEHGVVEDPATGSATGPLAAYMLRHGLAPRADGTRLVSEQGTHMGRRSLLHILLHGDSGKDGIEVGGHVTPLVEARMRIPGE